MKKSRHSEEKVIAAVKQMEGGRKTADVARELGVSAATLYAWKGKYGGNAGQRGQATPATAVVAAGGTCFIKISLRTRHRRSDHFERCHCNACADRHCGDFGARFSGGEGRP